MYPSTIETVHTETESENDSSSSEMKVSDGIMRPTHLNIGGHSVLKCEATPFKRDNFEKIKLSPDPPTQSQKQ